MTQPGRYYPLGYFLVFLPPVLLLAGVSHGWPSLLFVVLFGIAPLTRAVLGNIPEEPGEDWSEVTTTLLDWLPIASAVVSMVAVAATVVYIAVHPPIGAAAWLALGLSMWTCMLCSIPVAHELIHRRGSQRLVGNLLSGIAGYPELEGEHIRHHATSGVVDRPEWPRLEESVWCFAMRRLPHVISSACQYEAMLQGTRRPLVLASLATLITLLGFALAAGVAGAVLYLCVVAGIHFAVQAINYVQHWGLGTDHLSDADEARYGWECRCLLQGWLFLNIALHHSHHQSSAKPYYRLTPTKGSARLPGSYVPMLYLAMVPPLWHRLMRPAIAAWRRDPSLQREPHGGRIICLPVHYEENESGFHGL